MKKNKLFLFVTIVLILCTTVGCVQKMQSAPPVATPTPAPTPASTPQPSPTPTPAPTQTPEAYIAKEGQYTIAWMSDTQYYSRSFPETYMKMTAFLRDSKEQMNLRYIVHTGDLVNAADDDAQWKAATAAQAQIEEIPNGVLAGNHDVSGDTPNFKKYAQYFGQAAYKEKTYYGGTYKDNRGHYDLIDAGNTKYLFVYMSYKPDAAAIKWLNSVFEKYPDRVGVLCLHDYFTTEGKLSEDGKKIHDQVVAKNKNLYLVLCGHNYRIDRVEEAFDDDGDGTKERTVLQMICNYQTAGASGGDGYLRLFQVDEAAGVINVLAYSPVANDYVYFDTPERLAEKYPAAEGQEEFTFSIPWKLS